MHIASDCQCLLYPPPVTSYLVLLYLIYSMWIHMDNKCPVRYGREHQFSNISHSIFIVYSHHPPTLFCLEMGLWGHLSHRRVYAITPVCSSPHIPERLWSSILCSHALNLPEASLSCSRFWGLRRQKVSPVYVFSHPSKLSLTHISIDFSDLATRASLTFLLFALMNTVITLMD